MFSKVRRLKEREEDEVRRELRTLSLKKEEILAEIRALSVEYEKKKREVGGLQEIISLRAIVARIEKLEKEIRKLEERERDLKEKLMVIKKELKSIDIVERKKLHEIQRREIAKELLSFSYLSLLKKLFLLVLTFVPLLSFPESALQRQIKEEVRKVSEEDLREVLSLIEKKLQELREEREKLEALRKLPLTDEERKKLEKIVRSIGKAPSDEIAPAIEKLPPHLAAEVLLRLKERKAGEILANMSPEVASRVIKYILERNPDFMKRAGLER